MDPDDFEAALGKFKEVRPRDYYHVPRRSTSSVKRKSGLLAAGAFVWPSLSPRTAFARWLSLRRTPVVPRQPLLGQRALRPSRAPARSPRSRRFPEVGPLGGRVAVVVARFRTKRVAIAPTST